MCLKNIVWLQISAGQGPKECGWVVAQVMKKIMEESADFNLVVDVVENLAYDKILRGQSEIIPNEYLSVLLRIEGEQSIVFSKQWVGAIKWQGESHYRPGHKRCNWFVGIEQVVRTEILENLSADINSQVDIETMRSRGPGGQHVNKTSSAVRVTHRPSGIVVRIDSGRSQHRNKQLAMERLRIMLSEKENFQEQKEAKQRWLKHYHVPRGNPVKTFSGQEFKEKK